MSPIHTLIAHKSSLSEPDKRFVFLHKIDWEQPFVPILRRPYPPVLLSYL